MIKRQDIIQDNHPTLLKVATEVIFPLSKEDMELGYSLQEYLRNSQNEEIAEKYNLRAGVGIAAPQINVSKRMFAILINYEDEVVEELFINPKIIAHSTKEVYLESGEGCLSVDPSIIGPVKRYKTITAKYFDINGDEHKVKFYDYEAIVFQHEFDHLNGQMFDNKIISNFDGLEAI